MAETITAARDIGIMALIVGVGYLAYRYMTGQGLTGDPPDCPTGSERMQAQCDRSTGLWSVMCRWSAAAAGNPCVTSDQEPDYHDQWGCDTRYQHHCTEGCTDNALECQNTTFDSHGCVAISNWQSLERWCATLGQCLNYGEACPDPVDPGTYDHGCWSKSATPKWCNTQQRCIEASAICDIPSQIKQCTQSRTGYQVSAPVGSDCAAVLLDMCNRGFDDACVTVAPPGQACAAILHSCPSGWHDRGASAAIAGYRCCDPP